MSATGRERTFRQPSRQRPIVGGAPMSGIGAPRTRRPRRSAGAGAGDWCSSQRIGAPRSALQKNLRTASRLLGASAYACLRFGSGEARMIKINWLFRLPKNLGTGKRAPWAAWTESFRSCLGLAAARSGHLRGNMVVTIASRTTFTEERGVSRIQCPTEQIPANVRAGDLSGPQPSSPPRGATPTREIAT